MPLAPPAVKSARGPPRGWTPHAWRMTEIPLLFNLRRGRISPGRSQKRQGRKRRMASAILETLSAMIAGLIRGLSLVGQSGLRL